MSQMSAYDGALAETATGRRSSALAVDVEGHSALIRDAFADARVLILGGAGTIGSATLRALLPLGPRAVHVVDHNENELAELVRDLRSSALLQENVDFRLMPLDYGSELTRHFVARAGPYDCVLHFAAVKHVRSEKDVASILHMLDVNVVRQRRLGGWLRECSVPRRYFTVSTDKAANPVSFMGASKRLAEHLVFSRSFLAAYGANCTSARFANVAYSAGSLPAGWVERMRKRQPIAVPGHTRRFFVSVEEAAQICVLSAAAIPSGSLSVPRFTSVADGRELTSVARQFLALMGYESVSFDSEEAARNAVESLSPLAQWPLLITPRTTDGEKEEEEFLGPSEIAEDCGIHLLAAVPQEGGDEPRVLDAIQQIAEWVNAPPQTLGVSDIAACVKSAVPEFEPRHGGRSLDAQM